jgi:tetratricopeptide (TPR) repeat protein
LAWLADDVQTLPDLARALRELRRRHARQRGGAELTYRELAAATGWSHGIIGEYLGGKVLPPTDRFDALIRLFGASPAEQGALATARDRVEERRRQVLPTGVAIAELVPRQLPAEAFGFTGRTKELAELDALLERSGPAVVISAVSGTAGVGKTTLAVRWAHRIANQFPDGQLYLDLRGYDPDQPVTPAAALATFLRSLGLHGADIPLDLDERAACYRTLLAGRRVLVLLDNAYSADQVRPLLPGTQSCMVIVTSRDDLAGLVVRDGARRIDLDVLAQPEAVRLLRTLVGGRVDANPAAAAALADRCARLPLALRIAAELASAQPNQSLAELVADLSDERRRLDLLDATGDRRTAVRAVFSWSYQHLSPAAASAFDLLGLHPGRDIEAYALAALADIAVADAKARIETLGRAHLIEPTGPGRYALHDLLRAYAIERARTCIEPATRQAALGRFLDHQLATAVSAMDIVFPHDRHPDVRPAHTPRPGLDNPDRAQSWLDEQRANLVAGALYAAEHGWHRHTVEMSRTLWRYFEVGGHVQDALAVHTSAVQAATVDGHGLASVQANLGAIHWWLGDYHEALGHFEQALAGHRACSDVDGEARALARIGVVHERLGDYPAAIAHLQDALALFRANGDRHGEGAQLVNLGTLHRRLGRYEEAAERQRQAAAVFVETGDVRLHGYALGNLGAVYSLLGRHDEALVQLEDALANCRESADRGGEASALATIGAVYGRQEHYAEALDHLHQALAISRETGERSLETETLNTLGEVLRAMGEHGPALARHRAALSLTRQTGDRYEQARALDGTAQAMVETEPARAAAHWRQAQLIYETLGVPEAEVVRARLAALSTIDR